MMGTLDFWHPHYRVAEACETFLNYSMLLLKLIGNIPYTFLLK